MKLSFQFRKYLGLSPAILMKTTTIFLVMKLLVYDERVVRQDWCRHIVIRIHAVICMYVCNERNSHLHVYVCINRRNQKGVGGWSLIENTPSFSSVLTNIIIQLGALIVMENSPNAFVTKFLTKKHLFQRKVPFLQKKTLSV